MECFALCLLFLFPENTIFMGFFATLNNFDSRLLLELNNNFTNFWDAAMYLGTDTLFWIPMFMTIIYAIIKNKERESILIFVLILITLLLDDSLSTLIKTSVARLRPTHDPSLMYDVHIVNGYRGGLYGFVSSHAANSFGLALFLALLVRHPIFSTAIFSWAIFHTYTRIYLGVHFPLDIFVGMILGLVMGYGSYKLYAFSQARFHFLKSINKTNKRQSHTSGGFERKSVYVMSLMILFSFGFLLLASKKIIYFMS